MPDRGEVVTIVTAEVSVIDAFTNTSWRNCINTWPNRSEYPKSLRITDTVDRQLAGLGPWISEHLRGHLHVVLAHDRIAQNIQNYRMTIQLLRRYMNRHVTHCCEMNPFGTTSSRVRHLTSIPL